MKKTNELFAVFHRLTKFEEYLKDKAFLRQIYERRTILKNVGQKSKFHQLNFLTLSRF